MPFSQPFGRKLLIEKLRRFHDQPVWGYSGAIVLVGAAAALRLAVDPWLAGGLSFITFYPAIVVATLIGGARPGLVALALSTLLSWYFFLPPSMAWALDWQGLFSLLLFIAISLVNIAVVAALDATISALIVQEQNIRTLVEQAPNGIVVVDDRGRIVLVNPALERLSGYSREELMGKTVDMLVPERSAAEHGRLRVAYLEKPETRAMGTGRDLNARRKDGSEVPVEIGLSPVQRGDRRAVVATVIDITARRRVQDMQHVMIRELQHRTQNLFAVVQSIAKFTLSAGRTRAEGLYVFNQRLEALARAYDVVADAAWEGASLAEILERQFGPYVGRVSVRGCGIKVSADAAQQLALIMHELTTNALKYGALSVPEGEVRVEGSIDGTAADAVFSLLWQEQGGPRVVPPSQKGFGSTILVDVAGRFARKVSVDHLPSGLRYELQLSLHQIAPLAKAPASAAPPRAS